MTPIFSVRSFLFLGLALLIVTVVAITGSLVTVSKIPNWYAALNKPWFNPPKEAFGIVWPMLFGLMAFGFWRILRNLDHGKVRNLAIFTFMIQILFNAGWSIAFFGAESPLAGLVVVIGFWLAILAMILAFMKVDRFAAYLQFPYLVWVSFAAMLNFTIWRMN